MIIGRITSRGQITVPPEVRAALGLEPGDMLSYAIEDGRVILSKGETEADPADTLSDDELQPLIDAALADPRPSVPIDEAFAEVKAHIWERGGRRDGA